MKILWKSPIVAAVPNELIPLYDLNNVYENKEKRIPKAFTGNFSQRELDKARRDKEYAASLRKTVHDYGPSQMAYDDLVGKPPSEHGSGNPNIPNEARPELSSQEIQTLEKYSYFGYLVNQYLRSGDWSLAGSVQMEMHKQLASIFNKLPKFTKPVVVYRSMRTDDMPDKGQSFLAQFEPGAEVKLPGYTSTSTDPNALDQNGNVYFAIQTIRGLDMLPDSTKPHEQELLLNHNSSFKVISKKDNQGTWVIKLEQLS